MLDNMQKKNSFIELRVHKISNRESETDRETEKQLTPHFLSKKWSQKYKEIQFNHSLLIIYKYIKMENKNKSKQKKKEKTFQKQWNEPMSLEKIQIECTSHPVDLLRRRSSELELAQGRATHTREEAEPFPPTVPLLFPSSLELHLLPPRRQRSPVKKAMSLMPPFYRTLYSVRLPDPTQPMAQLGFG